MHVTCSQSGALIREQARRLGGGVCLGGGGLPQRTQGVELELAQELLEAVVREVGRARHRPRREECDVGGVPQRAQLGRRLGRRLCLARRLGRRLGWRLGWRFGLGRRLAQRLGLGQP